MLRSMIFSQRNELAQLPKFRRLLPTAEALCEYLGCIENGSTCGGELPGDGGVGTCGGSEDHTAIMCPRPPTPHPYPPPLTPPLPPTPNPPPTPHP